MSIARTRDVVRIKEMQDEDEFTWLIKKDACLHCEEPGCLEACPAPGAIVQYENGIVDFNQDNCIGCQSAFWMPVRHSALQIRCTSS